MIVVVVSLLIALCYAVPPHHGAIKPHFGTHLKVYKRDTGLQVAETRFVPNYAPVYGYKRGPIRARLFKGKPKRKFLYKKKRF